MVGLLAGFHILQVIAQEMMERLYNANPSVCACEYVSLNNPTLDEPVKS